GPAAAAGRAPCAAGAAPANHRRAGGCAHHRAAGSAGVHPLSGRLPLDSRLWSQPDLPAFRHPQIQLLLPYPASSRQNPEPAAGRGAAPLVEKIYLRSGKRISSEAIQQKLLAQGISISKRKVLSFLREWKADKGITSARMSAAAARRRFCHLNLLDRQFNP